eukprot:7145807-Alexandrium_andersonii.AAC.1
MASARAATPGGRCEVHRSSASRVVRSRWSSTACPSSGGRPNWHSGPICDLASAREARNAGSAR